MFYRNLLICEKFSCMQKIPVSAQSTNTPIEYVIQQQRNVPEVIQTLDFHQSHN